jgi:hypothetical protein
MLERLMATSELSHADAESAQMAQRKERAQERESDAVLSSSEGPENRRDSALELHCEAVRMRELPPRYGSWTQPVATLLASMS